MKIITVHTYYQLSGGEDKVFEQEADLLGKGNIVKKLIFRNKSGIAGLVQFLFSIWNIKAGRRLKRELHEFKPDILQIHNWHYASGPIIIRVAKKLNIPVVLTLHNYRLICPSGTLFNDGKLFTDSINSGFPWKAVNNKVYRNSFALTFYLAFIIWFHKKIGTWLMVDKYITLTDFAQNIFVSSALNIPSDRYAVKPNFVSETALSNVPRKNFLMFVGRLSEEKGIKVLLEAFSKTQQELVIAGVGPCLDEVVRASQRNANIKYLGKLNSEEVLDSMKTCSALIFPSIWYEGMPMTILEAFSSGTAVISGNLGAMSSMIIPGVNGLLYDVNNAASLSWAVDYWMKLSDDERSKMSLGAHDEYVLKYTPEANVNQLMAIYRSITN